MPTHEPAHCAYIKHSGSTAAGWRALVMSSWPWRHRWVPVDTHSTPVFVATGRLWVAPRATIAHTQSALFSIFLCGSLFFLCYPFVCTSFFQYVSHFFNSCLFCFIFPVFSVFCQAARTLHLSSLLVLAPSTPCPQAMHSTVRVGSRPMC